jgi:hypothetical protein
MSERLLRRSGVGAGKPRRKTLHVGYVCGPMTLEPQG